MADVRPIDANALKKTFEDAELGEHSLIESVLAAGVYAGIDNAPTIDAVPVVHGRWNWEGRFKACSECGTHIDWDNTLGANHWHYCPNCGAKMDKEATNDEP